MLVIINQFYCCENDRSQTPVGQEKNNEKIKMMASSPIASWQIDGEKVEAVTDFLFLVQKSLWMMTAAMKLKDTCSLEGKLWQS